MDASSRLFRGVFGAVCILAAAAVVPARAAFVTYEAAGADAAAITPTRDAFRVDVGGGSVAGANGSFGGIRREINWDGVPVGSSDPMPLAANFFNTASPRIKPVRYPRLYSSVASGVGVNAPIPSMRFPVVRNGDLHSFQRQSIASGKKVKRHRRASAQCSRQKIVGSRSLIRATGVERFVDGPGVIGGRDLRKE